MALLSPGFPEFVIFVMYIFMRRAERSENDAEKEGKRPLFSHRFPHFCKVRDGLRKKFSTFSFVDIVDNFPRESPDEREKTGVFHTGQAGFPQYPHRGMWKTPNYPFPIFAGSPA
ncbi:MAG TPA: hypothetical protein DDY70_05890 [Clostridiales bacterium]|nr:hypothetical protein [Clostridiales bacterium]